jgi:hypothetical protein
MVTIFTMPSLRSAGIQMKNRWVISDVETWVISRECRSQQTHPVTTKRKMGQKIASASRQNVLFDPGTLPETDLQSGSENGEPLRREDCMQRIGPWSTGLPLPSRERICASRPRRSKWLALRASLRRSHRGLAESHTRRCPPRL